MIDNFALLVTHALMLITAWRLLKRPDLDHEGQKGVRRWHRRGRDIARDQPRDA